VSTLVKSYQPLSAHVRKQLLTSGILSGVLITAVIVLWSSANSTLGQNTLSSFYGDLWPFLSDVTVGLLCLLFFVCPIIWSTRRYGIRGGLVVGTLSIIIVTLASIIVFNIADHQSVTNSPTYPITRPCISVNGSARYDYCLNSQSDNSTLPDQVQ
jgi:hypothetical protein